MPGSSTKHGGRLFCAQRGSGRRRYPAFLLERSHSVLEGGSVPKRGVDGHKLEELRSADDSAHLIDELDEIGRPRGAVTCKGCLYLKVVRVQRRYFVSMTLEFEATVLDKCGNSLVLRAGGSRLPLGLLFGLPTEH